MVRKELVVEEVQKLMRNLEQVRNIAIVAHVDHGKCISGDSRVMLSDGVSVRADHLFERLTTGCDIVKETENEIVFDVSKKSIKVFSLNKDNGRLELKPITYAWKLSGGKVLKIRLRNGLTIKTTPEHKFLTLHKLELRESAAGALQIGDRIVCARETVIEENYSQKEKILASIAASPFYVCVNEKLKEELAEKLKQYGIQKMRRLISEEVDKDAFAENIKHGRYPVNHLLTIARELGIPIVYVYDNVDWLFYRKGGKKQSHNAKPMKLPQNFESFFYLAGLLFGDGHQEKLVVGKPELGEKFVSICEDLGISTRVRDYGYRTMEIAAWSKTLFRLLNCLFDYPSKRKSHCIRMSDFLLSAPNRCVANFIKGYFDCDGCVEKSRSAISITSASPQMLKDLQLALLRFGCLSTVRDDTLYISGFSAKNFTSRIGFGLQEKQKKAEALAAKVKGSLTSEIIPLDKETMSTIRGDIPMNGITSYYYQYESGQGNPTSTMFGKILAVLKEHGATTNAIEKLASPDIAYIEVENIEECAEQFVYDFTIPVNHNYVVEGMVVHNTTMTDSLVARSGLISKELAGEQRVMDFEELEQKRGITIKAANISLGFEYQGKPYVINLIDTPGHVDFGGHVTRAMRAVDGVILVVDSVEGVMPQTETVLRQALKEKSKPTLFINKIDRLINELKFTPQQTQERLAKIIMDINRLIERYAPEDSKEAWKINVEKGNVAFGSAFNKWATSSTYMKLKGVSFKDIYEFCSKNDHKSLVEKAPIDEVLLTMVIQHLPNPAVAQAYRIPVLWKGEIESEAGKSMVGCNPNGKVYGVIFGVVIDKHTGEVGVARIFSGTVKKGTELTIASKHTTEKVQQVGVYMGPDRVPIAEVPAGNIAAIVGLKDLYVGETISEGEFEPFEKIKHYAEPVVTKSIEAKNTKDLMKLIEVLRQMSKEDPTLKVEINQETGEHLISGMGELHLEIVEYKIAKEKGVEIETSPPIVVYRETIQKAGPEVEGKSPNRHNKFLLQVEPVEDGVLAAMIDGRIPEGRPKGKQLWEVFIEGGMPREEAKRVLDVRNKCVLIDATKGVQYLQEVMELLLKGFEEAVDRGPLAKEKVNGLKIKLLDATIHEDPVHRGPAQIMPAIRRPIHAGMLISGIRLMEPKQIFLVQAPQEYSGDLITTLQGRRGEILEIGQEGDITIIKAKLPVAETFGMSNDLRSASQGRAIWYHEYAGYELVPTSLQEKIVAQIRERKGEPKEVPKPQDFLD